MTRKVIVGASCSGKSTYAWENRADDDLVVDFDRIAGALGNTAPHDSSGLIGEATFRARLSAINTAMDSDENSWIIHGNPSAEQIDEYIDAGAEFIVLDPGLDECLARAEADDRPEGTEANIRAWYDDPPTFPTEATVTTVTDTTEAHMQKITSPRAWFRIEPRAAVEDAPSSAEVYIYDEIGESWWGGIGPKSLVDEISALDVDEMTVHINSPGGAAWDGITIMNALRAHRADVHVIVDGIAASAASAIAMAGDTITMNRGAQMMIHDASGGVWGNAQDMEATAAILHKLSDSYADVYAARAGGTREHWRTVMQAETWYTAEEAVDAGLADSWEGSADEPAEDLAAAAAFDLSRFRFPGRAHAPAPHIAASMLPSSTEPGDPRKKEALLMSDTIKAGLRERLGLTEAEISDEQYLAAVDEALAEQADTEAAPVAAIPAGTQLIESNVLEQLRADANAGREAREQQVADRRAGIIATALREGRITAASAVSFRAMLDSDEAGTTKVLDSLAKNTVPVDEIGHAAGAVSAEDALYALAFGEDEKETR